MDEKLILQNSDIPTSQIVEDIEITEKELKDFQDEYDVLYRNPQQNKVRLYMLSGHIHQHQEFIDMLKEILEYRSKNNIK